VKRLVAIDPGAKSVALALFKGDTLWHCGLVRASGLEDLLKAIRELDGLELLGGQADEVVVEVPQIYPASKSKGDPNDLIRVALAAGGAAVAAGGVVKLVRPREWKGTVPKEIHNRRTIVKLRDFELQIYVTCTKSIPEALRHNVLDAVGLGLWRLKR